MAGYSAKPLWRKLGFSSLEDYLVGDWEGGFARDANDLLAMLWAWQQGDISANELYKGDLKKALGSIRAKAFVMPGQIRWNRCHVAELGEFPPGAFARVSLA